MYPPPNPAWRCGLTDVTSNDKANITITDEDGTENNPIVWYFRAGYSGTFDLGSNDDITAYMHPSGIANVANADGTRVTIIPFNGAAAAQ